MTPKLQIMFMCGTRTVQKVQIMDTLPWHIWSQATKKQQRIGSDST